MSTPISANNIYSTVTFPDTVNPYIYPTINVDLPRNYVPIRPNHVEFRVEEEAISSVFNNESMAWAYSIIYYLYIITINLIHLGVVIAGIRILVAADEFSQDVNKWIAVGIAIATAISLFLTDLMNGFEIQPKKAAFNGTIYRLPKWRHFF